MKRFILILLAILPLLASAQEKCLNFSIIDQKVVWQKTYECSLDKNAAKDYFRQSGIFKTNDIADDFISGEFDKVKIDYRKFGHKWGSTHVFLNFPISAIVVIDFKDNKYRVSLKNIIFVDDRKLKDDTTEIEVLFTKKKNSVFSENFVSTSGKKIDDFLSDLFVIKDHSGGNDW